MGDYNGTYVFNYTDPPQAFTNNAGIEYPSHPITVEIRLNPSNITGELINQIYSKLKAQAADMKLSLSNENIITVSGVPPDNNFDQNSVLMIVWEYNKGAQFAN